MPSTILKSIFASALLSAIIVSPCYASNSQSVKWADLADSDQMLINEAVQAMDNAYAPYSNYHVGAAIRSADGKIYQGFNIENASYGLSVCAERTALFKGITDLNQAFTAIAVVTQNGGFPCGSCRQVLNEFSPQLKVLVSNRDKSQIQITTLSDLLPESFGPQQLSN